MAKPRDYKAEYARFHGKPEQIKKRSQRVLARRAYEKKHGDVPTIIDIDHKISIDRGGGNGLANLREMTRAKNRGYARDKNNPKR